MIDAMSPAEGSRVGEQEESQINHPIILKCENPLNHVPHEIITCPVREWRTSLDLARSMITIAGREIATVVAILIERAHAHSAPYVLIRLS
jgi:hypothetical protein